MMSASHPLLCPCGTHSATIAWIDGMVTASPTPIRNLQASRVSRDTLAAVGDSIWAADQTSTPAVMVRRGPHTPMRTEEGTMDAM